MSVSGSCAKACSNLRAEVSREINGSTDERQRWEGNGIKSGVVGNLVSASDGLKTRHRNVGQTGVGHKSQTSLESTGVTDSGQVWRADGCEVVLV